MSDKKVKQKYTDSDLMEKMHNSINAMEKIVTSEDDGHRQIQAANALSGLVRTYKDMFGVAPEEKTKLKSVKGF